MGADADEEQTETMRDIQEFLTEATRKLAAQKDKRAVPASMLDSHRKSDKLVAASSGKRERKFMPLKTTGYTRQEAQAFCPPQCKLAKDLRENRWKVDAPYMASSKRKSYGRGTGLSDYDALKAVLLHTWREHRAAYGGDGALLVEFEASGIMPGRA